jgi:hypothetical protein
MMNSLTAREGGDVIPIDRRSAIASRRVPSFEENVVFDNASDMKGEKVGSPSGPARKPVAKKVRTRKVRPTEQEEPDPPEPEMIRATITIDYMEMEILLDEIHSSDEGFHYLLVAKASPVKPRIPREKEFDLVAEGKTYKLVGTGFTFNTHSGSAFGLLAAERGEQ